MIEIITEDIEMPESDKCRFQITQKDCNGRKWNIIDTKQDRIIGIRGFEDAALIRHNLNKKYYRDFNHQQTPPTT